MFSNRREFSKNGAKSLHYSEHAIYNSAHSNGIFNHTPNRTRMEKLFLVVLSWVGITSYIGAIILNIGNWKADTLFGLALMFGIVRFIRYSIKTWQDYRRGEVEIKIQKKKLN